MHIVFSPCASAGRLNLFSPADYSTTLSSPPSFSSVMDINVTPDDFPPPDPFDLIN